MNAIKEKMEQLVCIIHLFPECNKIKYRLIKKKLCNVIGYLKIVFINTVECRLSGPDQRRSG